MRLLVGFFLKLFIPPSHGLMPAAGELIMLSRLLIVPSVEHAVQIIWVNFCSLVVRQRASMVLQGSHIMDETGLL